LFLGGVGRVIGEMGIKGGDIRQVFDRRRLVLDVVAHNEKGEKDDG
jgi:hypothetical protein